MPENMRRKLIVIAGLVLVVGPTGCDEHVAEVVSDSGPLDSTSDRPVPLPDLDVFDQGKDATLPDLRVDVAPIDPSWLLWLGDAEGWAEPNELYLDGTGNAFVVGKFGGEISLGQLILQQAVAQPYAGNTGDAFVAKIGPGGKAVWATHLGMGTGRAEARGVVVSPAGEVWVAGEFTGTAAFGTTTLVSEGNQDGFIVRLGKGGNVQWAKATATGPDLAIVYEMAWRPGGGLLLAGVFHGTADFDSESLTSAGKGDGFVAALDAQANTDWVAQIAGTGPDSCNGVAVDKHGRIWVGGHAEGPASLGPIVLPEDADGPLVAEVKANGSFAWALRAQAEQGGVAGPLALASDGTLRVTGFFGGSSAQFGANKLTGSAGVINTFVASVDPAVPGFVWAVALPPGWGNGIDVSGSNETYVAAEAQSDVEVTRLDANGNVLGHVQAGGTHQDAAWDLALDGTGGLRVAGIARSQGQVNFGTKTVTGSSDCHLFLWSFPLSWL